MKFSLLLAAFSLVGVGASGEENKGWYTLTNAPGWRGYGSLNENGWLIPERFQNIETGAIQEVSQGAITIQQTASEPESDSLEPLPDVAPKEVLGPEQRVFIKNRGYVCIGRQVLEGDPEAVGKWRVKCRAESAPVVTTSVRNTLASSQEGQFLAVLNQWRASHGRHPIGWDQNLANYAATNNGVHAPHSNGGAAQCWASPKDLMASLHMWFASPAHASILLNANTAIGASICPTGCTANAR